MQQNKDTTKIFLSLVTGICLLVTAAVLFMFYTQDTCSGRKVQFTMKNDQFEHLDRYHDAEKRVTALRAAAANKCFVLINDDNTPFASSRALRIVPDSFSAEMLATVGGKNVVEYCEGLEAMPVELSSDEELIERAKRQAPPQARPGLADIDVEKVRRTQNRLSQNECQNEVLVDCAGNGGVYECVTGPGEVYRAKTQCESANRFSFNLATRCKEFAKTQKLRFIKCLQSFIYGTYQQN